MAESRVDDALWNEFHRLVNMTSRELEDWLRTDASAENTEAFPDEAGDLGAHVVASSANAETSCRTCTPTSA